MREPHDKIKEAKSYLPLPPQNAKIPTMRQKAAWFSALKALCLKTKKEKLK